MTTTTECFGFRIARIFLGIMLFVSSLPALALAESAAWPQLSLGGFKLEPTADGSHDLTSTVPTSGGQIEKWSLRLVRSPLTITSNKGDLRPIIRGLASGTAEVTIEKTGDTLTRITFAKGSLVLELREAVLTTVAGPITSLQSLAIASNPSSISATSEALTGSLDLVFATAYLADPLVVTMSSQPYSFGHPRTERWAANVNLTSGAASFENREFQVDDAFLALQSPLVVAENFVANGGVIRSRDVSARVTPKGISLSGSLSLLPAKVVQAGTQTPVIELATVELGAIAGSSLQISLPASGERLVLDDDSLRRSLAFGLDSTLVTLDEAGRWVSDVRTVRRFVAAIGASSANQSQTALTAVLDGARLSLVDESTLPDPGDPSRLPCLALRVLATDGVSFLDVQAAVAHVLRTASRPQFSAAGSSKMTRAFTDNGLTQFLPLVGFSRQLGSGDEPIGPYSSGVLHELLVTAPFSVSSEKHFDLQGAVLAHFSESPKFGPIAIARAGGFASHTVSDRRAALLRWTAEIEKRPIPKRAASIEARLRAADDLHRRYQDSLRFQEKLASETSNWASLRRARSEAYVSASDGLALARKAYVDAQIKAAHSMSGAIRSDYDQLVSESLARLRRMIGAPPIPGPHDQTDDPGVFPWEGAPGSGPNYPGSFDYSPLDATVTPRVGIDPCALLNLFCF